MFKFGLCSLIVITLFIAVSVRFGAAQTPTQAKIVANLEKSLEASTPPPLPQEPVTKKELSDTQDEGLKGKVKTVTVEDQDLSGTWTFQARHYAVVDNYNEKGNFLKRIYFDSYGNAYEVSVYGYIDGARVSDQRWVSQGNDPPPMLSASKPVMDNDPRDRRYSYKYEYKYTDGKMSEMQMFFNNGKPGMRYLYSRTGNILEKLVFDPKGKLNQKYISKLDERGNEVERTRYGVLHDVDEKYIIRYETFDNNGNWTKRVTSKMVTENGKEIFKPWYVTYRTITYFP